MTPLPTLQPAVQPTTEATLEPTTVQFRFENAQFAYVTATLRIDNFTKAEFGSAEIQTVQYAVFDVLGLGNPLSLLETTDDVSRVYAVDVASIDLSFAALIRNPSVYAASPQDLLNLVNSGLEEATSTGYLRERLLYWADFFGANRNIGDVNEDATQDNLDDSNVDDNFFFDLETFAPSVAEVTTTSAPTTSTDDVQRSSSKKGKKSSDDSATAAAIAVPLVVVFVLLCLCLYLYYMQLFCFAPKEDDDNDKAIPLVDDEAIIEGGAVETQETAVDEADVGTAAAEDEEAVVVEAPVAAAADPVQEKIIEADL